MSVNKKIIESEAIPPLGDFEFSTVIWSGNGSGTTQSITGVGFKPDLVWYKVRNYVYWNEFVDSTRGAGKELYSNSQNGESTGNRLTSFNSDGFSVTGSANDSGRNYVAWCWKANAGTTSSNTDGTITSTVQAANGFSIVTYTGTGSNGTIGHGLNSDPNFIITKARTTISPAIAEAWPAFHSSLTNNNIAYLDKTYAAGSGNKTSVYSDPTTTSTTFGIGNWRGINQSGTVYMAYCFHSVSNYSKIGSYTGTGTTNSITGLGFQPDWIMIKRTDSANDWTIFDSVRDGYTDNDKVLWANLSDAEATGGTPTNIDLTSDGFAFDSGVIGSSINANGGTYIYMAFKIN